MFAIGNHYISESSGKEFGIIFKSKTIEVNIYAYIQNQTETFIASTFLYNSMCRDMNLAKRWYRDVSDTNIMYIMYLALMHKVKYTHTLYGTRLERSTIG